VSHFVKALALAGIALILSAQGIAAVLQSEKSTVRDTIRGAAVYESNCAACHGAKLSGGQFAQSLKGSTFLSHWQSKSATDLLDFVTNKMPPGSPGSLSPADYQDVVRYIAEANKLSKGVTSEARADEPVVTRHIGPEPAPPGVFRDGFYRKTIETREGLLSALSPVTDKMLQSPPSKDWLLWRRTYENISFSPLARINRHNVDMLGVAWAWSLPVGVNETAPLVHDGVIFVSGANQVEALDAADGTLLWHYTRTLPPQYRGGLAALQRNFALYGENIYISTGDRHVVALKAKTGQLVWDHTIVRDGELPGVMLSAGPTAIRGVVIQGTSNGGACKAGCFLVGLDARTGREVWRFNTIARPGQPGGDTWNSAPMDKRYGGAVWTAGSYDPQTDLAYFGVGQTYAAGTLLLPGKSNRIGPNSALYTDSTIALNPETGHLAWYHQHLARDVWDLDEAFERALLTLPINGRTRQLVVTTGKLGILDALDRTTGAYVFSKDFGLQNVVVRIDPGTGQREISPLVQPQANKTISVCPSPEGVRNWMTTAYDPYSHTMYMPMEETCMNYEWQPVADSQTPGSDIGWTVKPRPHSDGNYAHIEAIDLVTRKIVWLRRSRAPLSSSLLYTEGGVLFTGSRDRMFEALDGQSGKTLWKVRLNAAPNSSPIAYEVGGREFLAVVTGGGGPHDSESLEITPEIENSAPSTTLWVFALPPKK
jgi:alcohol dehydrogenase (cytochrome c)